MAKYITIILGLIGLSIMTMGIIAVAQPQREPSYVEDAWLVACSLSRYTCEGLPIPKVFYAPLPNLWGMYLGSHTVFLTSSLTPYNDESIFAKGVLVHEMVHYLQHKEDGLEPLIKNSATWCAVEGEAYEVANQYWTSLGRDDLIRDWQTRGNCVPISPEMNRQEKAM